MADWAWPHTPASYCARIVLADGPFPGEQVGYLPPDRPAPGQIVWSAWLSGLGFAAWLYEWHGERSMDQGRTDALLYRCTGRRLHPEEIPPAVGQDADLWADGAALIVAAYDVPAELIWPGV